MNISIKQLTSLQVAFPQIVFFTAVESTHQQWLHHKMEDMLVGLVNSSEQV